MAVVYLTGRLLMQRMYHIKQRGFTITELLMSVTLASIIITVFMAIVLTTFVRSGENAAKLELNGNLQIALSDIERDIRYSKGFLTSIPAHIIDPNAPSGGWSHRGNPPNSDSRVLILQSNSTINNPYSAERKPLYIDGSLTNPYAESDPKLNCSIAPPLGTLYINPQLPYYSVYFLSDTTLYKRVLIDTTTTVCGSIPIYQKRSCPTGTGFGCSVKDEVVARDVALFSIDYIRQNDEDTLTYTTLDPYRTTNPDDIVEADFTDIFLHLQKEVDGKMVSAESSIFSARVNN